MGYLENQDEILINEVDSNGSIDVYIMKEYQFDALQDNGSIAYETMFENTLFLSDWSIEVTGSGDNYYVVLLNDNLVTGRTVYVDISVRYWQPPYTPDLTYLWYLAIIVPIIIGIAVITVFLIRKHKKKAPKEVKTVR